jgi:hypothetical protein
MGQAPAAVGPGLSDGEMIMEPASRTQDSQVQPQAPAQAGKLKIEGIITHERLITWIKERNPIIAQARKDGQRR